MKLTVRELFLLTMIVALVLGWWLDRTRIQSEHRRIIRVVPRDFLEAIELAGGPGNPTSYRLIGCEDDLNGQYVVHMGYRNLHGRGGGSYTYIQKIDGQLKGPILTKQYDVPPS
ncbi:hypothetical protein NA78x_004299 [Anatilimnocola sp. NA78]|uniref:hypothetical protein n=1 Tax=Anatilimnocola sp. NA78 TaxID=3415683 RepID=UPI003CE4676A